MSALSSLMDGEIPPPATTPQVSFTLVQNLKCLHTALHRGTMTRPENEKKKLLVNVIKTFFCKI